MTFDKYKRTIITREELDTLVEENPGRVIVALTSDEKVYEVTVVPAAKPSSKELQDQGIRRRSLAGDPVSNKEQVFVYHAKKKGELTALIEKL